MGVGCRRRRRRGHRDGLLSILILLHFLVNWHAAVCEQFRSRFRLPSIDSIVVVVGKSTRGFQKSWGVWYRGGEKSQVPMY